MLKTYTHKNVRSNLPIQVDEYFVPAMDLMADMAEKHDLIIVVTSAFRMNSNHLSGAIVEPATMSNHFVGCAVDVNFILDGEYINSKRLETDMPKIIQEFIDHVTISAIRWGGNFQKKDVVHLDNGLNVNNPALYEQKYLEYHPLTA